MKRIDLVHHLRTHGCDLLREGSKHSVFYNPDNGRTATVPRHSELFPFLARMICKELGIVLPGKKK